MLTLISVKPIATRQPIGNTPNDNDTETDLLQVLAVKSASQDVMRRFAASVENLKKKAGADGEKKLAELNRLHQDQIEDLVSERDRLIRIKSS